MRVFLLTELLLTVKVAVNESALTGESVPVDKLVGDTVSAANNQSVGIYPL